MTTPRPDIFPSDTTQRARPALGTNSTPHIVPSTLTNGDSDPLSLSLPARPCSSPARPRPRDDHKSCSSPVPPLLRRGRARMESTDDHHIHPARPHDRDELTTGQPYMPRIPFLAAHLVVAR